MGDSCHTQGPEGGIGLNLNYEIAEGFRDFLRENGGEFGSIGAALQERYEEQSKAGTVLQQGKKASQFFSMEMKKKQLRNVEISVHLQKTYPDKFILVELLIHFSKVPHQEIVAFFEKVKPLIMKVGQIQPFEKMVDGVRNKEVDEFLTENCEFMKPYIALHLETLAKMLRW